jgi:hypothetical protein
METFVCANCKREFPCEMTQEELKKQFEQEFPGLVFNPTDPSVCDECWDKINEAYPNSKFLAELSETN